MRNLVGLSFHNLAPSLEKEFFGFQDSIFYIKFWDVDDLVPYECIREPDSNLFHEILALLTWLKSCYCYCFLFLLWLWVFSWQFEKLFSTVQNFIFSFITIFNQVTRTKYTNAHFELGFLYHFYFRHYSRVQISLPFDDDLLSNRSRTGQMTDGSEDTKIEWQKLTSSTVSSS